MATNPALSSQLHMQTDKVEAGGICLIPGCNWKSFSKADLHEHYWSKHSSASSTNVAIRNPNLGECSGLLPLIHDPSILPDPFNLHKSSAFDSPFDRSDAAHNGFTTIFNTRGSEDSIIRTADAELNTPTVATFNNSNAFFMDTSLANPIFAPYPVAGPSAATNAYTADINNNHQPMTWWNPPYPADFMTFEAQSADNPNLTDLHRSDNLGGFHTAIPQESQPGSHNPAGPSLAPPPFIPNGSRIPCPHCSKTFARRSDMRRHARKHDPTVVKHPCRVAGCLYVGEKGFLRADKLRDHMRSVHGI